MPASSGIQRNGAVVTRPRETAGELYAADTEGALDRSIRRVRAALLLD
jgi:hypothetical protein